MIGSVQKRSVDGGIQRAIRHDVRVPLHTGGLQNGGAMETNRRTAVHIERKLICGVKECRCLDTCEGTVNTQWNKISHAEWEKADARLQAGGEYAYRGTKVGMLSGRRQMLGYKQVGSMHTGRPKLVC